MCLKLILRMVLQRFPSLTMLQVCINTSPGVFTHRFEENPYSAAQRFLARNDLPMEYLDQVVSFIEKNSGGVKVQSSQQFVDPYTGAQNFQLGYP
jgi:hypothetical protein